MTKYIVITRVAGKYYMTSVEAESLLSAEYIILGKSYIGRHTYGVESCMAFDSDTVKTDTYVGYALNSDTVSIDQLSEIIANRNCEIRLADEAEAKVRDLEKRIAALNEELRKTKAQLAS